MPAPTAGERIYLARLRAAAGLSQFRRAAAVPLDFVADMIARSPGRLIIAPQDIRTADPTVADDIYAGYYAFGAKIVNVHGQSPFAIVAPSPEWEVALMEFGWLRHLRAAGTPLAKTHARSLVDEWIKTCGTPSTALAWTAPVAARRLLSWLSHSPVILENVEIGFYRRFMRSVGRHIAWLQRQGGASAKGRDRLTVAIALAEAGLCSEGAEGAQRKAINRLIGELDRQILLDGGHIGRNPQTLVDVLLDLLPLRQAFIARSVAVPAEINNAIDRMMPMLRLFRHSDGALALFNGMGLTAQDEFSTVLAYDDARAQPLTNAIATGYQRLEGGDTILIEDTGAAPTTDFSSAAHAGALSFEMSAAGERIIVNCGAPVVQSGSLRQAARYTAAHSTLIVSDTSSCRFAGIDGVDSWLGGCILSGPRHVPVERKDSEDFHEVFASHDGYEKQFRVIHERTLRLRADGLRIEGSDRLVKSGRKSTAEHTLPVAIRFHLHPQIKAGVIENGQGALLVTPSGQQWIFHASGHDVALEESAFFASPEGTRATSQIVVSTQMTIGESVEWVLMRRD